MNNVESASAAGDNYNLRKILLADGLGAIVGSMLGSPFPPAVYIGHPGWKAVGGRIGYSLATGIAIALVCFLGLTALLLALIPLVAILPILLYIGLVIGAQAFQASPSQHAPAVVLAIIPNIAEWAKTQIDGALAAAGTSAAQVGVAKLAATGVLYRGLESLGGGSVLAGMVLGAMAAFIIDGRLRTCRGMGVRRRDPRVLRPDPRRPARLGGVAAGGAGLRALRRDVPCAQRTGASRGAGGEDVIALVERGERAAGVGHPSEDPALRLDHLERGALELGKVRADAVFQHDALEAAVVGFAHGRVHAHLGRHAAHDERADAAVVQHVLEIVAKNAPLPGLSITTSPAIG